MILVTQHCTEKGSEQDENKSTVGKTDERANAKCT